MSDADRSDAPGDGVEPSGAEAGGSVGQPAGADTGADGDREERRPPDEPIAVGVHHLSKSFPGTRALVDVTIDVSPGHIHALVGGNGSGKSTLIKVLAGIHHGDGGWITVGDTELRASETSPERARTLGLRFVHQNTPVFPSLSVAENLAIGNGFETTALGSIRWRALRRRTQELLDRYGISARPETLLRSLRPAERAMVAIARALQDQEGEQSGVLVLDEPTASLPMTEVQLLMDSLRRFADLGQTIVFVSHRLDEVIDSADRATVLRDGRLAGTLDRQDISEERLIELIAGRALDRVFPAMPEVTSDVVALEAKHLTGGPVHDVSFRVQRGEVLGVAGLLGSGRSELLKMLFGAYPIRSGGVELDGEPVRFRHIGEAMSAGLAYVPEDRGSEAVFVDLTVSENLVAASVGRYWRGFRLRNRAADRDSRTSIRDFGIRATSEQQTMATLSGGNQQKVILARWLERSPKVLLLDEPSHGVDVNARAEIYGLIRQAVAGGCAAVVVSSDFEELSRVCDRVIVLTGGRIIAEVRPPELEATRLTELAFSAKEAAV